jgi:hypothetical protein
MWADCVSEITHAGGDLTWNDIDLFDGWGDRYFRFALPVLRTR